jgi:threonine dehydratase
VDGHGFAETPFAASPALSAALGCSVWVKDETGNVAGSHKARHLMGLMIHLLVVEQTGLAPPAGRELAIASCGNAALAAAVVARAAERPIRVFVPTWADPDILARLRTLDAMIEVCEREEGVPGDPTYHALRRAIEGGAVPFTCQGPDNGLTIEGGQTLGYELVSQLSRAGEPLDRLVVQVGGGALASACVRAFEDAALLEAPERLPRIHAVQTENAHPLERAFMRVRQRAGHEGSPESIVEAMTWARSHRSEVMWPWEEEPKSMAEGILDDETYDWAAVVGGMLATGATPTLVSEERLAEANDLARRATGIAVSHTGSSGLAGLMELADRGELRPEERVAVLFTGVGRGAESS